MTEEEATRQAEIVLRQAQQRRWQQCHAEIEMVLAKYGCALVGQATITPDGRISANVAIVDAPKKA